MRYLSESHVRRWLRDNWSTWQQTNPPWFTEAWRKTMGERSDFPQGMLPRQALAQIKSEKEAREAAQG